MRFASMPSYRSTVFVPIDRVVIVVSQSHALSKNKRNDPKDKNFDCSSLSNQKMGEAVISKVEGKVKES